VKGNRKDVKRELARGVRTRGLLHDFIIVNLYNAQSNVECNLIIVRGIIIV
jgi:hypothetical protein